MEAYRGTILSLDRTPGVRLRLDTSDGSLAVHLGPAERLGDLALGGGDLVEGVGRRVFVDGEPLLLAMTLRAHGREIRFRDDDGRPSRG